MTSSKITAPCVKYLRIGGGCLLGLLIVPEYIICREFFKQTFMPTLRLSENYCILGGQNSFDGKFISTEFWNGFQFKYGPDLPHAIRSHCIHKIN